MNADMFRYLGWRLIQAVPVVIGITILNFFIVHLAPGDVVDVLAGDGGGATPEYMAELRHNFGLDQPLYVQFYRYFLNIAQLNLGYSFHQGMPVFTLILSRLPPTILLLFTALTIAVVLGTLLGVIASSRAGSKLDIVISVLVLVSHAMPSFWLGLMGIVLFSAVLGWLPSGGMWSLGQATPSPFDVALHLILPALTLANFYLAFYVRLARASMLEVSEADYIRTARAKGASETRVTLVHTLRNALLPIVTMIGLQSATLLSGSVVVESVFGWPGLGRLVFDAITARDLNLLLGILLFSSILVVLINLATDMLYRLLDPRVELGEAAR